MTNMRKAAVALAIAAVTSLTTAAAVSASTGTSSTTERDAEIAFTNAHLKDATISQADAEKAATDAHEGASSDVHLESEDKGLVWEVKINGGSQVWEVQIGATSGKVVSDQTEG
jgi:uncharacterized membrane protein YkoI